jgi:hypothetical protein
MRFLLYGGHGLIDANIPTVAALRERLRLEVAARPRGVSDLYVLIFERGEGRFLGRRRVLVEDGYPVLVSSGHGHRAADQRSALDSDRAGARLVLA